MGKLFATFVALAVSGCGVGGMWINGNLLDDGVPYVFPRDRWIKEGSMSLDQRINDWVECGGDYRGGGQSRFDRFPGYGDESIKARVEFYKGIERCMLNKGYKYIGECRESNSHYPSCGGS